MKNYIYHDYTWAAFKLPFNILLSSSIISLKHKEKIFTKKSPAFSQTLRGLIYTIPLLIIFTLLFSSADMVFDKYSSKFFSYFSLPEINFSLFVRIAYILVYTFIFTGIFKYVIAIYPKQIPAKDKKTRLSRNFDYVEISIVLGCVNALFLAFIFLQFKYLFGGENNIINQGFTYAEYARDGFFQLILVVVISFLLIRFIERNIASHNINTSRIFKILGNFLILQVIVVTISAFKRLNLYESAYGYTSLRLYSHIFIIFLAIALILLAAKIVFDKKENEFVFSLFILFLITLAATNIINPDAIIARKNIERYIVTEKLDTYYLSILSNDANPEIIKIISMKNNEITQIVKKSLCIKRKTATAAISQNWQSMKLSNYNANKILEEKIPLSTCLSNDSDY